MRNMWLLSHASLALLVAFQRTYYAIRRYDLLSDSCHGSLQNALVYTCIMSVTVRVEDV